MEKIFQEIKEMSDDLKKEFFQSSTKTAPQGQKSVVNELNNLKKAGLGETENYRKLEEIHNKRTRYKDCIEFFGKILEQYPEAMLISWTDFYNLCDRYGLICGPISVYSGIIPEKNIQEIKKASLVPEITKVSNFHSIWTREVTIISDSKKDQKEAIKKISRYPLWESFIVSTYYGRKEINGQFIGLPKINLIIDDWREVPTDWLIAAPINKMENNVTIKVKTSAQIEAERRSQDPIVFKATLYGPLIISMWGKEADDTIFDKFKDLA